MGPWVARPAAQYEPMELSWLAVPAVRAALHTVMYLFRFATAPGITWSAPDPWPLFDPVGQFWQLYDSAPFVVDAVLSPINISPKAIVLLDPSKQSRKP